LSKQKLSQVEKDWAFLKNQFGEFSNRSSPKAFKNNPTFEVI
jgi:hypothetical protein